jgi:hexosaminidase
MKVGNLAFRYDNNGVNLKYKGVTVIRRSSLYVVSPGWTKLLFGHNLAAQKVTCEDVLGGKLVKVSMANDVFSATYSVTMLESDTVTIDLAYKLLKDEPAEMEYCLGYFAAPILADSPFEADTVEGPRSGIVPHSAKSSDQHESMLVPAFHRLRFDSRLAGIELSISGDEPNLVIFDARKEPQPWAREAPVFWCGLGSPQRPIKYGKECHIISKLTFTPRADSKIGPVILPTSAQITPVKNARIPANDPITIIPEPKSIQLADGDFAIGPEACIVLPDKPTEDDRLAADCLTEELRDIFGVTPKVISAGEVESGKGIIAIGEPARHSVLARLCKETGIEPPAKAEGYALKSCPQFVLVAGSDVRGTFYGVQTLIQLLKPAVSGVMVQGAVVTDWPTMKIRGAHVFVGNESKPFLEKLIRRIFARYKMNYLIIQADYTKWDTSPGIWLPWSTSKADLREIISCARRYHMEVVPLVQSLGHSEWAFQNGQNLDLAEDKEHPYSFCPSNPDTYKFIFSIYQEALDLFQSPVFHIGHDEVTMRGGFDKDPECRKKSVTELWNADVGKIRDFFAKKGVRVMLWGDMMLHKSETPDAGWAESAEGAKERREALPKDIIIADWHYCAADDFPSVRLFQDLGHEVIACTWYNPHNIEDFSRSAKKDGAEGLVETLWAGYHISEKTLGEQFQQFHAYILTAEYAWNTGETKLDDLGYLPAEEFTKVWRRDKADHTSKDGFLVDLSVYANRHLTGASNSWLGYGSDHDLREFKSGRVRLRGVDFDVPKNGAILFAGQMNPAGEWPSGLRIPIGRTADTVEFLLCAGWHTAPGTHIGRITVKYSETESMVLDLVYGENIAAWDDSSATPSAFTAWVGKTSSGDRAVIRMIEWRNPMPEKPIQSIEITSSNTEAAPILFAVTGLTSGA